CSGFVGAAIPIPDPGDGLALRVGGGIANLNSWTEMGAVNSTTHLAPANQHHEHGLRCGVGLVILVAGNDSQLRRNLSPGPVALLAGLRSGNEPAALHGRRN